MKKSNPLVTFALFAYNQEEYIREAVEGAFSQTYEPLEIILSDDCSSDRTFDTMKDMADGYEGPHKIVLNKNEENLGLANHINKIIQISSAEIITWIGGDDISLEKRVSILTAPLLKDDSIIGVHSSITEIDEKGNIIKIRRHKNMEKLNDPYHVVKKGASVVSQSHAFRKKVFEKFGPLNNEVNNEGKVMAFRESVIGEIIYLDEVTCYYRLGSGVSNYSGNDVDKVCITEPIKICSWYYFSLKQILLDTESIDVDSNLVKIIQKRLRKYELLYYINKNNWNWKDLFKTIYGGYGISHALKAFVRRNSPYFLKHAFVKYFKH